jgi:transcriptional regulator with PAS, ATPase and Fis domain
VGVRRPPDPRNATTVAAARRDRPDGWSLVVISDRALRAHALQAGEIVIGRTQDADIQLDDASISRRHGRLHVGDRVEYEDLGSANGSRIADRRLAANERVELEAGDSLELGDVLVVLQPRVRPPSRAIVPIAPTIVIDDTAMKQLHRIIDRIAIGTISVLLLGETGVGKEITARTIHDRSPRVAGPFVSLNCAALSEQLLESEMFGYEKGAFTGADRTKPGLLETADGGTIFLDEIGEMPLALQSKLLRALEERQVLRVGALRPRSIDVRFIAATNRDLDDQIARGAFRSDLYFRLNGISLVIPPLRARRSEILTLAQSFIAATCRGLGRAEPTLSEAASAQLVDYEWPGNVRELRNAMERAVLLADDVIAPEHVLLGSAVDAVTATRPPPRPASSLSSELDDLERQRILEVLERCGGNQSRAAHELGIARGTLSARLKAYGVKPRSRR